MDNFDEALKFNAEITGNLQIVKLLIEKGANIHVNYEYPIRASASQGHFEVTKFLIENGADINILNNECLRFATKNSYFEIVKLLIENGANIHADNDFSLRISVQNGNTEIVKLLIQNGGDIHVNNDYPLKASIKYGYLKIVKLLIQYDISLINIENEYPLITSIDFSHLEIIKYLIENGANIYSDNIIYYFFNFIIKYKKNIEIIDYILPYYYNKLELFNCKDKIYNKYRINTKTNNESKELYDNYQLLKKELVNKIYLLKY